MNALSQYYFAHMEETREGAGIRKRRWAKGANTQRPATMSGALGLRYTLLMTEMAMPIASCQGNRRPSPNV